MRYTAVVTRRFSAHMAAHCAVGPDKNKLPPMTVRLSSVYAMAKGAGSPRMSRPSMNEAASASTNDAKTQNPKPIRRCWYESAGQHAS